MATVNPELRPGFVRRRVREDEMDSFVDNGWVPVAKKEGDRFKTVIGDAVGNAGNPGKLYLIEIPEGEEHKKFVREHQGGKLTEMQNEALRGKNNFDDKVKGGESISTTMGMPPQARIKR